MWRLLGVDPRLRRAEPSFGPPATLITLLCLLTFGPACAYTVSQDATEESDSSDPGQSAYTAGRFIDALRIWRPRAEQGDARAAFGLGLLYDLGEGVGQDAAAAYGWYRRAAEAGYVLAEFNIAVLCDSGTGTARNPTEAALWYARAAAHGYARAEYDLAQLYEAGEGVPRNLDMAASWYTAAAGHGLSAAAVKLASLREERRQATVSPAAANPTLAPAVPTGPPVASASGPGKSVQIELSWAAPAQPVPVEFFVQVLALDKGGAHRVFTSFSKQSAVLVSLPRVPADYAWRVYTVAASVPDYAPSAWNYFSHTLIRDESTGPVSSPSGDAIPATDAAAVANDASPDAKAVNEAARTAAPLAGTDVAAGTELAALTADEICQRDGDRLARLRSNPSSGEAQRFANELGCETLRPQILSLMESLAPTRAAADAPNAVPPGAQAMRDAARPASPTAGADVASLTSDEACKRDEDRLVRLRASPSGEEAQRFASALGCEALRPQLQRLMESLGRVAAALSAPGNSSPRSDSVLAQVCASERAALDRLRKEPSAEAARLFWRDLKCEGLRPQVRLLMESLNVAPESVGSAAAPGEAEARAGATSDAPTANGADTVACRRETAELDHIRATLDLGDAKRFASAVTCDALKPQAARLVESLKE